MTREQIVAAARVWLGTPYRLTGRDRHGVDCCNFPAEVLRGLGCFHYTLPAYRRIEEPELITLCEAAGLVRLNPAAVQPGDVLIFRAYAWRCHPAIKTDRGVIHCPAAPVIEEPVRSVRGQILAAFAVPGVV